MGYGATQSVGYRNTCLWVIELTSLLVTELPVCGLESYPVYGLQSYLTVRYRATQPVDHTSLSGQLLMSSLQVVTNIDWFPLPPLQFLSDHIITRIIYPFNSQPLQYYLPTDIIYPVLAIHEVQVPGTCCHGTQIEATVWKNICPVFWKKTWLGQVRKWIILWGTKSRSCSWLYKIHKWGQGAWFVGEGWGREGREQREHREIERLKNQPKAANNTADIIYDNTATILLLLYQGE